ncbi:hypothetical protein GA707_06595 [Nostocoides sp. F2B08]|uniref:hypothetical protein n=1 Tax=Nostocoides sp. F2B08 TaxID=2653936 RepID=UPI0012631035|nr:hypothetical protein [Tetrasphaera sp. F2B08]KAB7745573.1 hypothetical protein GA707_06595 [Tetrasphaera sp. F2B08]
MMKVTSTLGRTMRAAWRNATRSSNPVYFLVQIVIAMAGGIMLSIEGAAWTAVGTGLIATGIAGLVAFFHVLLEEGRAQRQRSLERSGLHSIFATRSVSIRSEYEDRLRYASRQIDILGFGLNSLRQDFSGSFDEWAKRCNVRVLLLDPDAPDEKSSYADARDREEGANLGTIRAEVRQFLDETQALRNSNTNFTVRLYRTMPSVNIFRVDSSMFFGPYLLHQPSRRTPTLLVGDGFLFDRLMDHFEQLWSDENSRPAP